MIVTKKKLALKNQKEQFDSVDMKVNDINYDNNCELIAIRANGFVEIYSIIDDYQNINLICKFHTHENLTGLEIGKYKDNDHISKRMIHVQMVSRVARTIGRALNLNEDLIEENGEEEERRS